jgi:hypothetical protein
LGWCWALGTAKSAGNLMDNVTGSEYVCQDEAANPSPG